MTDQIAHYGVHCKNCGSPMWLQTETLRQTFLYQVLPCTDEVSFGVVCPQCKRARNYSISKNSADHGPKDHPVMGIPRKLKTVFVKSLKCDGESCNIPLLLFAQWSDSTTNEDRIADQSGWKRGDDLHCPNKHTISVL